MRSIATFVVTALLTLAASCVPPGAQGPASAGGQAPACQGDCSSGADGEWGGDPDGEWTGEGDDMGGDGAWSGDEGGGDDSGGGGGGGSVPQSTMGLACRVGDSTCGWSTMGETICCAGSDASNGKCLLPVTCNLSR